METNDTICAISTPPGVGGIAVCRISGPQALTITAKIWRGADLTTTKSHTAHLGTIIDTDGTTLDQAVATIYKAPHSFTTQDTVELSVHGSTYIQQALLNTLMAAGARLAHPGEFTRRAFIAGRFDLAQAEAVADLIASTTRASHDIAVNQMKGNISKRLSTLREQLTTLASLVELELDFSEEDVQFASRTQLRDLALTIHHAVTTLRDTFATGQAIKNGIPTAIVGATNAGKSSLLNTLLGDDRAIVSNIHGTTRDIIEDTITLPTGTTLRLMDTAGLRDTADTIEQIGINRTLNATTHATIIIAVIAGTDTLAGTLHTLHTITTHTPAGSHLVIALNKTDLDTTATHTYLTAHPITTPDNPTPAPIIPISALHGTGIDTLRQTLTAIADDITTHTPTDGVIITNARHAQALNDASQAIERVITAIDDNLPGDLLAMDIRLTIHHLASITGDITTDQILSTIFSRFCIGK